MKPKTKNFGLFRCFEPISKQPKQTETNRSNHKFLEKYPNILSFKLFGWVFCFLRFNRNIETLCFCIEVKQPKHTVSKKNRKKPKKTKKKQKKTKKKKKTKKPEKP